MQADNIGIKFTTIGGQAALAQSTSIAKAMEGINIQQMKLVRSQTTATGITRTFQTTQQRLVTSTQKAGEAQQKYTKVVKDTTLAKRGLFGQTQSVLSAIGKVATWTIATTAVFGIVRALTGLVKTLMDFENAMARVTTVTRGGAEALLRVRNAVKEYGRTTSAALIDVGKAAYYLGSAGLTAMEQVAGLEHVMDLTVGTMGVVDQVARLVAGAYNVFGQNMEGAITASEKMQNISDILAHTYSTQQVELSEIASAMGLVGSVAGLINMPLNVLVGTLGELNSSLLKGTRAGTSLMNAFLQISKKSDQLTDKLGVVFDPTKPLDFVEIMEKLNKRYGEGALSVMELKEIMDVFGLRGGRAVGILINRYERWRVTVNKGKEDFEGFADLMREQFENTLPRQLAILGNEIQVRFIDMFEESGNAFTRFLKRINEGMKERREDREKTNRLIELTVGLYGEELLASRSILRGEERLLRMELERGDAEKELKELMGDQNVDLLAQKEIYDLLTIDESDILGKAKEVNEKKKAFLELLKKASGTEGEILEKMRAIYPELIKVLGAETARKLILEGMLQTAIKNLDAKKDDLTTTKEILYSIERSLVGEKKRHNIQMMRMDGYSEEQIAHQNLVNFVEKINAAKREELGVTENIVTLEQLLAATDEERLELLAPLGGNVGKNMVKLQKLYNKELEAAYKITAGIADNLERAVESGIEALVTGTKDWKQALQDIGKVMLRAQISEVGKAIRATGIFKTVASGIVTAHRTGGDYVKAKIKEGFAEGAVPGAGVSRTGAGLPPSGGTGGLFGGGIDRYGIQRGAPTNAPGQKGRRPVGGGGGGGQFRTQLLSSAISGAIGGYGATGDIGGAIGGALGGMAGMALMATPLAPLAPLMPLLGGWLGGLFGGGKKEPQIQRKEEDRTSRVTSKLDITNKQLEWVNRNLVALRVAREPYPMPESAYFAERWGGRGGGPTFGNIIIHVGSDAQGSDVADAFAERFIVHGNRILQ